MMPMVSQLRMAAALATPRMTALRPGQSPPPVTMPIFLFMAMFWVKFTRSCKSRRPMSRTSCASRGGREWGGVKTSSEKLKRVLTLALTFYPLPAQERKWLLAGFGFADDCPANSIAGFSERRRIFSLSANVVGGEGRVRWRVKPTGRDEIRG